jgi:glycine/D-amino acid oxidase-like deaminating enzyme
MSRVVVLGAGISGHTAAALLRKEQVLVPLAPSTSGTVIHVIEGGSRRDIPGFVRMDRAGESPSAKSRKQQDAATPPFRLFGWRRNRPPICSSSGPSTG